VIALDAYAEARVRGRSVAAQVEVPLEGGQRQVVFDDARGGDGLGGGLTHERVRSIEAVILLLGCRNGEPSEGLFGLARDGLGGLVAVGGDLEDARGGGGQCGERGGDGGPVDGAVAGP